MKKVLFATTALIATAGMASAELTFGGSARFGIVHDDSRATDETRVHNRFTLNVDGSAETDSGLEFFGRVRVRGGNTGDTGLAASGVSAPRVGVRTGGFTLAVGNINGALESTPGLYDHDVGLTGLGWGNLPINASSAGAFAWDSFSSGGSGSNGIEAIYENSGFGFHLSYSGSTDRTAVNLSYEFADWTFAVGHQKSGTAGEDMTLLTAGGNFGNISVSLAHALNEGDFDATRIGAGFEVGASTNINVHYTAAQAASQDDAFGIGLTHSLGGATLATGISKTFAGATQADFGVRFSF